MSSFPDSVPPPDGDETSSSAEPLREHAGEILPAASPEFAPPPAAAPASFFEHFAQQPIAPTRFPNIADLGIFLVMLLFGWMGSGALTLAALHYHLFGVSTIKQAMNDVHYALGSQAVWYVVSFTGCALLFPAVWHTGLFAGLEWRAEAAMRMRRRLMGAVAVCIVLAVIDGLLLPGPKETPIDEIFRMPGAAWLLFAFGVTLAPFFEEMAYRGFLLPALCTAYDWCVERIQHRPAPWPDAEGKTQWSLPAMVVASVVTSIPFALMHGEQTGYALGPFVLLVCVSLALCWIRLSTRSLAASTIVHACYNLLLFSIMLAGTDGFKHMDKM